MTEKHIHRHETGQEHEQTSENEVPRNPEVDHVSLKNEQEQQLEASRLTAEEHAIPSRLLASEKDEPASSGFHIGTLHALKKDSYANLLTTTRRHLPTVSKQFSKLIHQKNIEALSDVGAQTVARPSGLLGGGIGALIGSVQLLYYAKPHRQH